MRASRERAATARGLATLFASGLPDLGLSTDTLSMPLYPCRFGKYLLLAQLGKGGMGRVHLALMSGGGPAKLVAIKQVLSGVLSDDTVGRFLDEANLVIRMSHGNLVPVFDAGKIADQYYLVMDFIEGKDLRTVWIDLAQKRMVLPRSVRRGLFVIQYLRYPTSSSSGRA